MKPYTRRIKFSQMVQTTPKAVLEPGFARVAVHPGFPRHRVSCPRLSDHHGQKGQPSAD